MKHNLHFKFKKTSFDLTNIIEKNNGYNETLLAF